MLKIDVTFHWISRCILVCFNVADNALHFLRRINRKLLKGAVLVSGTHWRRPKSPGFRKSELRTRYGAPMAPLVTPPTNPDSELGTSGPQEWWPRRAPIPLSLFYTGESKAQRGRGTCFSHEVKAKLLFLTHELTLESPTGNLNKDMKESETQETGFGCEVQKSQPLAGSRGAG